VCTGHGQKRTGPFPPIDRTPQEEDRTMARSASHPVPDWIHRPIGPQDRRPRCLSGEIVARVTISSRSHP
jgi:hypothetical protein